MILLGLDFETDSPDPLKCNPIEWGSQTYNTATKGRGAPFSKFIHETFYPPLPQEIKDLTGIEDHHLHEFGCSQSVFLNLVDPRIKSADMLVAYNAQFDRTILKRIYDSFQMRFPDKPWFCMRSDLPWPQRMQHCQKFQHRALDLGLAMDNRDAHRAMADVTLMWDVLDLWNFEDVYAYSQLPWTYLWADIEKPWIDGGKGRDAAKALGFGWEQCSGDERKFPGKWVKRIKEGAPLPEATFNITELRV